MHMNKIDYMIQISCYHREEMVNNGISNGDELKKLTLKEIKELYKEVL